MAHKRRTRAGNGHSSTHDNSSSTATNSSTAGIAHTTSSTLPTLTPAKKSKKPTVPGRVLSFHNLPSAALASDIYTLFPQIEIAGYRRTIHSDNGELSNIAFVSFATVNDAMRVFLQLDGAKIGGETTRVNFVNGVVFDDQDATKKEGRERLMGGDYMVESKKSVGGSMTRGRDDQEVSTAISVIAPQRPLRPAIQGAKTPAPQGEGFILRGSRHVPGAFPLDERV